VTGPEKPLAIIVDLDETLCTQFDVPVDTGVELLRRVDQHTLQVHNVTARTEVCREATERFIGEHRLPGSRNVHYCPIDVRSLEHKRERHELLSQEFRVIASIGDSFEEEQAAEAMGISFVKVDACNPADAWIVLAARITEFRGFTG
jgi:predicted secreted acid phosphatase